MSPATWPMKTWHSISHFQTMSCRVIPSLRSSKLLSLNRRVSILLNPNSEGFADTYQSIITDINEIGGFVTFVDNLNRASRKMGQAFRRASGRFRTTSTTDATSSWSTPMNVVDRKPPTVTTTINEEIPKTARLGAAPDSGMVSNDTTNMIFVLSFHDYTDSQEELEFGEIFDVLNTKLFMFNWCEDVNLGRNADNVLEERDPKFDAMLGQMVGRIKSKPGGKLEMGEAFVVEQYKRPLPKLRNTKPDYSSIEDAQTPSGTLNVAQLRHIVLLHEGKAADQNGPMNAQQIAEKFRVDVAEVHKILQFISLPPEEEKKEDGNKF
ncbi:hypothetical protein G4B88_018286 [Cannabis sativa]|uniref:Uncharacterized protein n=1 Tax=Cannabis sativa TaxID=3483 RepID=A0A7J6F3C3_CANSA|nr:hypothetical protein G4B88_018286 [Cannabis sativa]